MVPNIAMYYNNSIKHQSFVYTQLNNQIVLKKINLALVICLLSVQYQTVLFDP